VKANLNRLSLAAPANCVQKNGAKRRWRSRANWLGSSCAGGARGAPAAVAVHACWGVMRFTHSWLFCGGGLLHHAPRCLAPYRNDCGAARASAANSTGRRPMAASRCLRCGPTPSWPVASNTAWSASSSSLAGIPGDHGPQLQPQRPPRGSTPGPAPPACRPTAPRPRAAGCPCGPIPARQRPGHQQAQRGGHARPGADAAPPPPGPAGRQTPRPCPGGPTASRRHRAASGTSRAHRRVSTSPCKEQRRRGARGGTAATRCQAAQPHQPHKPCHGKRQVAQHVQRAGQALPAALIGKVVLVRAGGQKGAQHGQASSAAAATSRAHSAGCSGSRGGEVCKGWTAFMAGSPPGCGNTRWGAVCKRRWLLHRKSRAQGYPGHCGYP
jgi:hypothetical protein